MRPADQNRFEVFFEEDGYLVLKNHLYNYQLRKRAVEKHLEAAAPGITLEVGSGISPVSTNREHVVYSDLSFSAMRILKHTHGRGAYVVADSMHLPFKDEMFSQTVSSEVLEHLADDRLALREMARVMKQGGQLTVTFPHRKFYFANDDRYVKHHRRYELEEMEALLKEAGMQPFLTQKILGPLEKLTMAVAVFCFSGLRQITAGKNKQGSRSAPAKFIVPLFRWANYFYMWLAWVDARIMPRSLATVLLLRAVKKTGK